MKPASRYDGKIFAAVIMATALILPVQSASAQEQTKEDAKPTFSSKSLTLELASRAAWAAIKECRRMGFSVAVAVVDLGGNTQTLLRDRFAGPHTPKTAIDKAWTANSFRQNTGTLARLLMEGGIPGQVAKIPGALLVGGGRMIRDGDGSLVASIGVSGAPPGKSEEESIDGACAQAGINAIEDAIAF